MRKARLVAAVALCALAVVPARASTPGQPGQPNNCQIILDRAGDLGGALSAVPLSIGSSAPIDLRGVAIHTGLYGVLTVDVAVTDADAPQELPGMIDRYEVSWQVKGTTFWAEAFRMGAAWSYQIRVRPPGPDGALDEYAIPAMGDVVADTIRIHTQETILGAGEGSRIVTDVRARAERSLGGVPLLADTAPDTVAGATAIALDAPCPTPTAIPIGDTAMCRTLADGEGDVLWRASTIRRSAATDITGMFVQHLDDRMIVELGVVDLRYLRADGVELRYTLDMDVAAAHTVRLIATWAGGRWDLDASRITGSEQRGLTVAGSAGQNRVRFELAAHEIPAALVGMPLSNFTVEARQTDPMSVVGNVHDVARAAPGTDHFVLGVGCP